MAQIVIASNVPDGVWRQKVIDEPMACACTFSISTLNLNMPALVTAADGDLATLVTLAQVPATQSVTVSVNGVRQKLGGLTADCYFSGDGGTTARTIGPMGNLAAGDELYWNGSIAGFELDANDVISWDYFYTS